MRIFGLFTLMLALLTGCSADGGDMDLRVHFAVLGDSDSHSFHDSVLLGDPQLRGAEYRANTFQWTEILGRLRPQQINLGEWNTWGMPGRVAAMLGKVGLEDRAPRKQDYRYNFALSGARCAQLTEGMSRQVQPLVYLMDREPAAWAHGIVTIRIGINDIGVEDALDRYAASGLNAATQAEADNCTRYIRDAVALIRANHKTTRIVLVGILNNADFVPWIGRWTQPEQLHNIAAVMDAFDATLKKLAAQDDNILFWDDRAWFANHFGDRDAHGMPRFRGITLSGSTPITYTQGNEPTHAILADNHAGTVWNGLWARDLLAALNRKFGYQFEPIADEEIGELADPSGRWGIAVAR